MSSPLLQASPQRVGGGLIVLGLAAAASSFTIALGPGGEWGARFFPLLAAGALILTGFAEFRHDGAADASAQTEETSALRVLFLAFTSLAYIWLISKIGFLASTALVAPLAFWQFGMRRPLLLLLVALLVPLAFHFVFFRMLGAFPPLGAWFDILDYVSVL